MSCNSNPMYLDFWPVVSRVWKLKFNIDPILIYVDEKDLNIDESFGKVIKLTPIKGISSIPQSQFARLWYLQFLFENICITSDIDMIPLSPWFFKTQLKNIDSSKYILMSADDKGMNICYNVASGNKFKEMLELSESWEDQISILNSPFYQKNNEILWASDEIYLEEKLKNKSYMRLIGHGANSRIDRSNWNYDISKLKLGMYYDCHSLRPYNQYKNQIDNLINNIFENA